MAKQSQTPKPKNTPYSTVQQAVVVGMLQTYDVFQYRMAHFFRTYGLTQPQYNVLRILRGAGEPLPSLEVANRLITKVPAITSLIDKLEKRGLVARDRCTSDRRVWFVSLTDAGTQLLKELDKPVSDNHKVLCAGLSSTECQQLADLMEKTRAALPHS